MQRNLIETSSECVHSLRMHFVTLIPKAEVEQIFRFIGFECSCNLEIFQSCSSTTQPHEGKCPIDVRAVVPGVERNGPGARDNCMIEFATKPMLVTA